MITKAQKECPYCHRTNSTNIEDTDIYIEFLEFSRFHVEGDGYMAHREVHYCPICGRKLR
jgi:RNA polymerase subunit RPABC4/transcription elongation factor Spt4